MSRRLPNRDDFYDVIVIGGGVNGLVCATELARARRRVLLVEAREEIGGAAMTRHIAPNITASGIAHLVNGFDACFERRLRLKRHGLAITARHLPYIALARNGPHLTLWSGKPKEHDAIAAHAPQDKSAYESFAAALQRLARALRPFLQEPVLARLSEDKAALKFRRLMDRNLARLSAADTALLSALLGGPLTDVLEARFEGELLKGALAFLSCFGRAEAPSAPGSGLAFLWRLALETENGRPVNFHPQGGVGQFAQALSEAGQAAGVALRVGVGVSSIAVDAGRATGVLLETGEYILSDKIVSAIDPKTTLLKLVPQGSLDTDLRRRLAALRIAGMSAKLNLALAGVPKFTGLSSRQLSARLLIAPGIAYVEQAWQDARRQGYSADPAMEITIPSIHDNTLAPVGTHVLSAIVHYAGTDASDAMLRERFLARIVHVLEGYAPGLSDLITAGELLMPADLDGNFGIKGGDWHHGMLAPDQLYLLRPVAGASAYATPLPGLFLCGAGTHPGGGLHGLAGRNAARALLEQDGKA